MDMAYSINDVPIRLTTERWFHIVENHDDLAGHYDHVLEAIENPDMLMQGYNNTLVAIRGAGKGTYLAVIYREISSEDGFVITAYFTSKLNRRKVLWKR